MKVNKNIFICALLVLMLLLCVNAASAEDTLDANLTAEDSGEIAVDEASSDVLSASGDTYVVDTNGGEDYLTVSSAGSDAAGGETIFVKNGDYSEADALTKSASAAGESQDDVKITDAADGILGVADGGIESELQRPEYDVYVSPDGDGDGFSIDSPTNLVNAIDIVPEGGSIFMLNGNYELQDYVAISKSLHIYGESRGLWERQRIRL